MPPRPGWRDSTLRSDIWATVTKVVDEGVRDPDAILAVVRRQHGAAGVAKLVREVHGKPFAPMGR